MPVYAFYHKSHVNERYAPMSKIPKRIKCSCGKAWAKLGLAINLGSFVRNAAINQKTKEGLRWAFGKKKASGMRTTKDVDAALSDVARRYPHLMPGFKRGRKYDPRSATDMKELGTPSYKLGDPFPEQGITEGRNTSTKERSER